MMKPMIIMTQVIVAAAGRRSGAVCLARSTSREVPEAPTPMPTSRKARVASRLPTSTDEAMAAVADAAPTPPRARTAMPPMIQGVRRPPTSEP